MSEHESSETPHQIEDDADDQVVDTSYVVVREDVAASRTVASRQHIREQLSSDVEAFLARGGKIARVDANVSADPPKRPENTYGQRPI